MKSLIKKVLAYYVRAFSSKQREHLAKVFHALAMIAVIPFIKHIVLDEPMVQDVKMLSLLAYGIILEILAVIALIAGEEKK